MSQARIAKFEKVSFGLFAADLADYFPDNPRYAYERLTLPARATSSSAGYDFVTPVDIHIERGQSVKVPTGIRCSMLPEYVLTLYPRSGLSLKYGTRLLNTVGVIDADYYFSSNEGHIILCLTAEGPVDLTAGQKIVQGIFLPYGITIDDNTQEVRNGGFGSTGK